jgi:hypothetical protein
MKRAALKENDRPPFRTALRVIAGVVFIWQTACQTPATPEGQRIDIRQDAPKDCDFIERIEVRCCQLGYQRDRYQTENLLRNTAADTGANVISDMKIFEDRFETGSGPVPVYSGVADAWACPES